MSLEVDHKCTKTPAHAVPAIRGNVVSIRVVEVPEADGLHELLPEVVEIVPCAGSASILCSGAAYPYGHMIITHVDFCNY